MGLLWILGFTLNTNSQNFEFNPNACATCGARCCMGTGYVFVSLAEIEEIAGFLAMSLEQFGMRYLRRVGNAYSLLEQNIAPKPCVFLDMESKRCRIYPVRPKQCRTYPFWKNHPNMQEPAQECPGVVLKT